MEDEMNHFKFHPESDMVVFDEDYSTQCVVYDKTPGTEQKKIIIVVRPGYSVGKVINDITTQFNYKSFDVVFQPVKATDELVYLSDCQTGLMYAVPGFQPECKNNLIILPPGGWDGDTNKRYDLSFDASKSSVPFENSIYGANNHNNNKNISINANNNGHSYVISKDYPSMPSTMTTVTSTTTTSMPHSLQITPTMTALDPDQDPDMLLDDDLALGASASPTETEPMNGSTLALRESPTNNSLGSFGEYTFQPGHVAPIDFRPMRKNQSRPKFLENHPLLPVSASANGYVGLVNQAMTCYLNSLLQALYMTPEFRNALYRWEFDKDSEEKNIPYQLQKLFLNLQTSKKPAVETTDLTRSFGWDSTEAWQQHDIQELCRVMFDALEHKFKNTKQANLISNLYEGKMIDYVKCLECNTEKTRADTFLDIPLPVRPFGSSNAYGSIEEALRAFVQPETLDGNNQYFCEKCDKKCDAHKGLKFKTFPYILTLHLKRFDFDYSTMHRIKLNDKVTFPQILHLNNFFNTTDGEALESNVAATSSENTKNSVVNGFIVNGGTAGNTDDCSTTDSGSAMEEDACSSIPTTASSSQHENDMQDDDEGIDISSSTDQRTVASDEDQNLKASEISSGPYVYELFAIMIHSGSASGGHYYAYIKEFENNEWYCFNDQTVSPITQEDIQKSFGGSSTKAYYSSVYSSSTNAYMLMYRQMDPQRNEHAMQVPDFPEHITKLLPRLHSDDDGESRRHLSGGRYALSELSLPDLSKQRVYFYNPQLKKLKVTRVYVSRKLNVDLVLESAHLMLNVESFAPITRCRLVGYDATSEEIVQSFENVSDRALEEIRASFEGTMDFLLEYRAEGQVFEIYEPGGTTWYVYMVNLNTMEMDGPYLVYSAAHEKSDVLRHSIAVRLHVKENELLLATFCNKKAFVAYDPAPTVEAEENLQSVAKSQFRALTYFYMNVPSTDAQSLETLEIPSLDAQNPPAIEVSSDVVDAVVMNSDVCVPDESSSTPTNGCLSAGDYNRRDSSLPGAMGHESNSEDSSLSDGDRTLVESIHNRGGGDSQFSSTSHSPQLSSPEDDSTPQDAAMSRITAFFHSSLRSNYKEEPSTSQYYSYSAKPFFHAIKIESCNNDAVDTTTTTSNFSDNDGEGQPKRQETTSYKVILDSRMKMEDFKRNIESLIRVPANYFTITRKHDSFDPISSSQSLVCLSEGETLVIHLGKVLQENEHKAKIYYMKLSELNDDTSKLPYVFEWICKTGMTVTEAKKSLIAQLHRLDKKYDTLSMDNCRIWTKGGRNPIKILANDEALGSDVRIWVACEFIVQECEEGVPTETSDDSLTLFVRQWHPDTLKLGRFQEITLENKSEIRAAIAKISTIAEENISYSKLNSSFPCTNYSLLNINSMSWINVPATLDKYPLTTTVNGNIYFYKDLTVSPKELSIEERRLLTAKEKGRLDRLGCTSASFFSPRRERALKIHVDSSPQTTEALPWEAFHGTS